MDKPVFTIIMSTYNRAQLVTRAINSVLNQTYNNFEFLIIDNGSTDNTSEVIKNIKDNRIKYILNPNPTNSCDGPRNIGIKMANADLIAFLDDDDIWYSNRLEKVKEAFDNDSELDVVCHNEYKRVNGKIRGILEYNPHSSNIFEVLLYEKNCFSPCATTIRTQVLRDLNGFSLKRNFDKAADYDFWLRMTKKGVKVFFIEEPLGEFTFNGNNWSIIDTSFDSKIAFIVKEHIMKYENKPLYKISNKGLLRILKLYYVTTKSFIRVFNIRQFMKYTLKILSILCIRPILLYNLFYIRRTNNFYKKRSLNEKGKSKHSYTLL